MVFRTMIPTSIALVLASASTTTAATITVDRTQQHQTILGWGGVVATPWATTNPAVLAQEWDVLVNDVGITRARLEPNRVEVDNDDGDPFHAVPAAFDFAQLDQQMAGVVAFRQRVVANGEPFSLYASPSFYDNGSSGEAQPWLYVSPGEYTEYAQQVLGHLRTAYGIDVDYWSICNEAGNNNEFSPQVVTLIAHELGPRLYDAGLPTRLEYPETAGADMGWTTYVQPYESDTALWPYVGVLTWHDYGSGTQRPALDAFAQGLAIPAGQTEYDAATFHSLVDDLTNGGVSFWEEYGITGPPGSSSYLGVAATGESFGFNNPTWQLRQVFRYVRPGAVRIAAGSDDARVSALAFEAATGVTAVAQNTSAAAQPLTVAGLAAGTYAVSQTIGVGPYTEQGLQTVGAAGTLSTTIAANAVLTITPHAGANLAPVLTGSAATPAYLAAPASAITLAATAQDPETAALTFAWTVVSQPAGAAVRLATPGAATTAATGLTAVGEYVFEVSASDGTSVVRRRVYVPVYAGNQPPFTWVVNNRIPKYVTLPSSTTELDTLTGDVEGDAVTILWSVVSQPPGANAVLTPLNATRDTASNLTIAGDYVFRVTASDARGGSTHEDLTVHVYPPDNPPVISMISASPSTLALPVSTASLAATTSDPDGDVLTHWWFVTAAPASASPRFANPSSPDTTVSGLGAVGVYTFELAAISRIRVTRQSVRVTVTGGSTNTAPTVDAGPDQTVSLATVGVLAGTAVDDGLPAPPARLTYAWSQVSGPAAARFTPSTDAITNVRFPSVGTYALRLTASDSVLSGSDDVLVTVGGTPPPVTDGGTDIDATLPSGGPEAGLPDADRTVAEAGTGHDAVASSSDARGSDASAPAPAPGPTAGCGCRASSGTSARWPSYLAIGAAMLLLRRRRRLRGRR